MNTLERVRADLELGAECGVANVNVADLSALLRAVEAARKHLFIATSRPELKAAIEALEKDTQG